MYRLVYLLIFSAAAVKGAKQITLDIKIESETETSCQVTPVGTQTVTEDEHIQFNILTPTKLVDFWCNNGDALIYNSGREFTEPTNYNGTLLYKLPEKTIDYEYDINGTWKCTFQILNKGSTVTRESTCLFHVKVTDKPGVSLSVANLGSYNIKNKRKQYSYTFFTESEKRFDCILANPTEKKETYTISFKLDDIYQKHNSSVTINPHSKINFTDVFKLSKDSKLIVCSADSVSFKQPQETDLYNEISLRYIPPPRVHLLTHIQPNPQKLKEGELIPENNTQIYDFDFTDGEEMTINCALNKADGGYEQYYSLVLCIVNKTCTKSKGSETSVSHTFMLEKGDEFIYCTAVYNNRKTTTDLSLPEYLYNIVQLHTLREDTIRTGSGLYLKMKGLPDNSNCIQNDTINQKYNYAFNTSDPGTTLNLECVLTRTGVSIMKKYDYEITFKTRSNNNKTRETTQQHNGTFEVGDVSKSALYDITLEEYNTTVKCIGNKVDGNRMTIELNVFYIPPPTSSTNTNEPPTTPTIESTNPTVQVPQPTDPSSQSREGEESSTGWVKWLLVGGALLITICVVVGCLVMHCQKKPTPADSTYANLGKDQNKPTPLAAPRTIQKPNAARKPNVTLENNYSEPKDSQDMSEALYADPNRFVGDSSSYAEPYVAKPSPQCDMYAEPYKSNYAEPYPSTTEGNYAELSLPDCSSKELYAKPIPKAQRKPKVKDDCNYSNVFGGQYGNTKK